MLHSSGNKIWSYELLGLDETKKEEKQKKNEQNKHNYQTKECILMQGGGGKKNKRTK